MTRNFETATHRDTGCLRSLQTLPKSYRVISPIPTPSWSPHVSRDLRRNYRETLLRQLHITSGFIPGLYIDLHAIDYPTNTPRRAAPAVTFEDANGWGGRCRRGDGGRRVLQH